MIHLWSTHARAAKESSHFDCQLHKDRKEDTTPFEGTQTHPLAKTNIDSRPKPEEFEGLTCLGRRSKLLEHMRNPAKTQQLEACGKNKTARNSKFLVLVLATSHFLTGLAEKVQTFCLPQKMVQTPKVPKVQLNSGMRYGVGHCDYVEALHTSQAQRDYGAPPPFPSTCTKTCTGNGHRQWAPTSLHKFEARNTNQFLYELDPCQR